MSEAVEYAVEDAGGEQGGEHEGEDMATTQVLDPMYSTMHQQLETLKQIDEMASRLQVRFVPHIGLDTAALFPPMLTNPTAAFLHLLMIQEESKMMEALQAMEKGLILRGHCFGLDSIEVYNACKAAAELSNYLGMLCLQQTSDKPDEASRKAEEQALLQQALELLKKGEILSERHPVVRAVSYNNLSCLFRKQGKLRVALGYIEKAIQLEARHPEGRKAADSHINACTILSELHRHEAAFGHAHTALNMLLLELFSTEAQQEREEAARRRAESEDEEDAKAAANLTKTGLPADRVAVLAIAYFNMAVQQEFLRKYSDALISYEKVGRVPLTWAGDPSFVCISCPLPLTPAHSLSNPVCYTPLSTQPMSPRRRP